MLKCRQARDLELAAFCAILQTMSANQAQRREYLRVIPQLARSLKISEQTCLEYCRHYALAPRRTVREEIPPPECQLDNEGMNEILNFFIPFEEHEEPAPLSREKNWNKLEESVFCDLTGDGTFWPAFVGTFSGCSVAEAKELREKIRQLGAEASGAQ